MSDREERTREKIIFSALRLFSEIGISKTSMNDVAFQAGVTRVTVYRYFADKRALVREVFLRVERVFQEGLATLGQNPEANWKTVLDQIGEELSALPKGDAFARANELKRLYPDIYSELQNVRESTLNGLFDRFFAVAESRGLLRSGLNRPVTQGIFWELIINFFDNPRFASFGLSDVELFRIMTDILLHGILKDEPSDVELLS